MSEDTGLLAELSKLLSLPGEVEKIRKDVSEWIEHVEAERFTRQLIEAGKSINALAERVEKLEQDAVSQLVDFPAHDPKAYIFDPEICITGMHHDWRDGNPGDGVIDKSCAHCGCKKQRTAVGSWWWAQKQMESGHVVDSRDGAPYCMRDGILLCLTGQFFNEWVQVPPTQSKDIVCWNGWKLSDVPHPDAKVGLSPRQEQQRSEYIAHLESAIDKLHGEIQRAREAANAGMSAIAPGSFMWAVEQMRNGKAVKRLCSHQGVYISNSGAVLQFGSYDPVRMAVFYISDFTATDWQVAQNGK